MSSTKFSRKFSKYLQNAISFIVFLFLDFLDSIFCIVYKIFDMFFEGKPSPCYCEYKVCKESNLIRNDNQLSESLYERKNIFSKMIFLAFPKTWIGEKNINSDEVGKKNRWSDCNCEFCISWIKAGDDKLHVVVKEPSQGSIEKPIENVIFIHGMYSSSSFWTESVFPNLSEIAKINYRMFAIDILGFGRSPKPINCQYNLKDHLEMIEKSVINPYELKSFHLVAHSMGCIIALAMASKYSHNIKSVTLVSPACFPCSKDESSLDVLKKVAPKKLWPPKAFHLSVTSWYEHLGRNLCFLLCRNHQIIRRIIEVFNKREPSCGVKDLIKHTHNSVWHTTHNVVCGGAKLIDGYLEILKRSNAKISIVHGDGDKNIPFQCSYHIKSKIPNAELNIIPYGTHNSVIFHRKKEFTRNLENFWASKKKKKIDM